MSSNDDILIYQRNILLKITEILETLKLDINNNIICNEDKTINLYVALNENTNKDPNCSKFQNILLFTLDNFYEILKYFKNNIYSLNIENYCILFNDYKILINKILLKNININYIDNKGLCVFSYKFLISLFIEIDLFENIEYSGIILKNKIINDDLKYLKNNLDDNFLSYCILNLNNLNGNFKNNLINEILVIIDTFFDDKNFEIFSNKNINNLSSLDLSIEYPKIFFKILEKYTEINDDNLWKCDINPKNYQKLSYEMKKKLYKTLNPEDNLIVYTKLLNINLETFGFINIKNEINKLDNEGNNFLQLLIIKLNYYIINEYDILIINNIAIVIRKILLTIPIDLENINNFNKKYIDLINEIKFLK